MWEATSSDAMAVLRVICGLWFLPHVIGKALNAERASSTFAKAGFRPAKFFVWLTICLEIAATVGLVFGIYVRLAAACAVVVLLGAAFAMLKINGWNWRWQKLGPEYMLFWAVACVLAVLR